MKSRMNLRFLYLAVIVFSLFNLGSSDCQGTQVGGGNGASGAAGDGPSWQNDAGAGTLADGGTGDEVDPNSPGAFSITLLWDAGVDLDLWVRTPLGEEIYYRNRNGLQGGRFAQDGCIQFHCEDGPNSEMVTWPALPPGNTSTGNTTYEFWAINYNGGQAADIEFVVQVGDTTERFTSQVGDQAKAKSETFAIALDSDTVDYQFEFESPRNGGEYTPHMWLKVNTNHPYIDYVTYYADEWELGTSDDPNQFPVEYTFTQMGERTLQARGYDSTGMQVTEKMIQVRVVDPNAPPPGSCMAGDAVNDAQCLLNHDAAGSITLFRSLPSGVNDNASPYENIQHAAAGESVYTSCYGTAPCRRIRLSERLLGGMVSIIEDYGISYRVTTIAGGSHSSNSYHYSGTAVDIDIIDGRPVSANITGAHRLMRACQSLGAVEVLGPGYRGHDYHVHCAWP